MNPHERGEICSVEATPDGAPPLCAAARVGVPTEGGLDTASNVRVRFRALSSIRLLSAAGRKPPTGARRVQFQFELANLRFVHFLPCSDWANRKCVKKGCAPTARLENQKSRWVTRTADRQQPPPHVGRLTQLLQVASREATGLTVTVGKLSRVPSTGL